MFEKFFELYVQIDFFLICKLKYCMKTLDFFQIFYLNFIANMLWFIWFYQFYSQKDSFSYKTLSIIKKQSTQDLIVLLITHRNLKTTPNKSAQLNLMKCFQSATEVFECEIKCLYTEQYKSYTLFYTSQIIYCKIFAWVFKPLRKKIEALRLLAVFIR